MFLPEIFVATAVIAVLALCLICFIRDMKRSSRRMRPKYLLDRAIADKGETGKDALLEQAAALCLEELEKYKDSERDYRVLAKWLGRIRYEQGRFADALEVFQRRLTFENGLPSPFRGDVLDCHVWLGHVCRALGNLAEAERHYRFVIDGDINCGLIGAELQQIAIKCLILILRKNPGASHELSWLTRRESELHAYLSLNHSGQF